MSRSAVFRVTLVLVAVVCLNVSASLADMLCPECGPNGKDRVREAIRAERARDDARRAAESADRPWDHRDFGRKPPAEASPPVWR
jgi:hypothetical protein